MEHEKSPPPVGVRGHVDFLGWRFRPAPGGGSLADYCVRLDPKVEGRGLGRGGIEIEEERRGRVSVCVCRALWGAGVVEHSPITACDSKKKLVCRERETVREREGKERGFIACRV